MVDVTTEQAIAVEVPARRWRHALVAVIAVVVVGVLGVLVYRVISFWLVMIIGWAVMGLLVRRSRRREAGPP